MRYNSKPKENINSNFLNFTQTLSTQAENILQSIENKIKMANKFNCKNNQNLKTQTNFQFNQNKENISKKMNQISIRQANTVSNIQKEPYCKNHQIMNQCNIKKEHEINNQKNTLDLHTLCDQGILIGNYKLECVLGSGSYATVRLGIDKQSKEKYAIKVYEKNKINDPQKMNNIKREISILKRINHKNIIKLHYAIEDRKTINLVMDYSSKQSLSSYVKTKPKRNLSQNEALHIFQQIASAIQYLHNKNIAHRDIKMENILLTTDNQAILIDFGFSICVPNYQKVNVFCGTPSYMSPELVSKIPHIPFSSDIWSLGILLFKLLTSEYPFKGANEKELQRAIQFGKLKFPTDINDQLITLIKGCLEKDIKQRYSINQIMQSSLFQQTVNIYTLV